MSKNWFKRVLIEPWQRQASLSRYVVCALLQCLLYVGKTQRVWANRLQLWSSQSFCVLAGQYRSSVDLHSPKTIGKCQLNLCWFSNSRLILTQTSSRCLRVFLTCSIALCIRRDVILSWPLGRMMVSHVTHANPACHCREGFCAFVQF